jgi:acyl-CoA hydrolase
MFSKRTPKKFKALEPFAAQVRKPDAALADIRNGDHVFVGTGCAAPQTLLKALDALPVVPADLELLHFFTINAFERNAEDHITTRFRHRVFFVGTDMRGAVKQGLVEYVPMSAARVPEMIERGRIRVDVALIQVSLPDEFGYVSLGVSVDIIPAAVARARLVIAEVNPAMPRSMGDSTLHVSRIHHLVPVDVPVTELGREPAQEEAVQRIARYIAGIIEDGSTLQVGLGKLAHEALQYVTDRKDLGIHSEVVSDAILPLLEHGCLTGARKTSQPFKIVTSMALGSRALYDLIDRNPLFVFQPIDVVCNPATIAAQHKMVSIGQAFAIDLTGQACVDQFDGEFYGGIGVQEEFLSGASRSRGGKPILCMTSTTDDGATSRIRAALLAGEAATIARTDVHYVVTEYGIAYLFGKSIRQRATALIELAHPKFRPELFAQAQALGYLPPEQTLQNLRAYPVEEELTITLKDGRVVMLRPAQSSDAQGIRELFHHLSEADSAVVDAAHQGRRERRSAGQAPQVAGAHDVDVERVGQRLAQPRGLLDQAAVVQHHGCGQQQRRGVGHPLARDVRGRAVHGLEDGRVGADVGAGRHAQPAHQPGHQVGQDVAEEVGRDQHVELPGIQHQLHRAGVDDHRFQLEAALVLAFVEVEARLQEDAGQRLHDVGLVHDADLAPPRGHRVLEGELQQPAAAGARIDAGGHGHRMRVVVDLHVVLVADVQAFEVFAHHHEVDLVEAAAGDQRQRRAQVGVELERLAQAHVGAAVAAARGRLQRALQRQPRAADAVQRGHRQGVAGGLHALQAGDLAVPLERGFQRLQHRQRGVDDLGADAVAGDQRGGNA